MKTRNESGWLDSRTIGLVSAIILMGAFVSAVFQIAFHAIDADVKRARDKVVQTVSATIEHITVGDATIIRAKDGFLPVDENGFAALMADVAIFESSHPELEVFDRDFIVGGGYFITGMLLNHRPRATNRVAEIDVTNAYPGQPFPGL